MSRYRSEQTSCKLLGFLGSYWSLLVHGVSNRATLAFCKCTGKLCSLLQHYPASSIPSSFKLGCVCWGSKPHQSEATLERCIPELPLHLTKVLCLNKLLWFNSSPQVSTTEPLAHSPCPSRGGGGGKRIGRGGVRKLVGWHKGIDHFHKVYLQQIIIFKCKSHSVREDIKYTEERIPWPLLKRRKCIRAGWTICNE